MRFGKLILIFLLLLPCSCAFAASQAIDLKPGECTVSYSTDLPDQDFLLLTFTAPQESG